MKNTTSIDKKNPPRLQPDSNKYEQLLKIVLFVYPLLFIWQGLGFSDTGFWLTNYDLIFRNPASIANSHAFSGMWLSCIIGGLWLSVFGWLGVIGVKIGFTITCYLTMILAYKILKNYCNHVSILFSFLIVYMFVRQYAYADGCIGYNDLTALFYVVIVYLLYQGLKVQKPVYFLFSGILSALNIFIRLPNILGVGIILMVVVYELVNGKPLKHALTKVVPFVSGVIIGIGIVGGLMFALGHYHLFINSLQQHILLLGSNKTASPYSTNSLIIRYLREYYHALLFCLSVFVALGVLLLVLDFVKRTFKNNFGIKYLFFALYFVCLLLFIYLNRHSMSIVVTIQDGFIVMLILVLIVLVFIKYRSNESYYFLILSALFVLVVTPYGSLFIFNALYAMWLATPIAFDAFLNIDFSVSSKLSLAKKINWFRRAISPYLSLIRNSFFISIFFFLIARNWVFIYTYLSRVDNRIQFVYTIPGEKLAGSLESREAANNLRELLTELKRSVKPGDTLLITGNIPILYYLTDTKPYLNHSWVDLLYPNTSILTRSLDNAREQAKQLPLVVRRYGLQSGYPEAEKVVADFLTNNSYRVVWKNAEYEVLSTGQHVL